MLLSATSRLYTPSSVSTPFQTAGRILDGSISQLHNKLAVRTSTRQNSQARNVLIINGHPDPSPDRFCSALCDAYSRGAKLADHTVRQLDVGQLSLALARVQDEKIPRLLSGELDRVLEFFRWAHHFAIVYPLWIDSAPLPLQQLLTAAAKSGAIQDGLQRLRAQKTAHVVVTMQMQAATDSCFDHVNRSLARRPCDLRLPGIKMEAPTYIGCVNTISQDQRKRWLESVGALGSELR